MRINDIMLTGVPRSGTTLVCHLLNKLPDAIALAEPIKVERFAELPTRRAILDWIEAFAVRQRETLLSRGAAVSKHKDGSVPVNLFGDDRGSNGLRRHNAARGQIGFDKPVDPDFKLIIKHPAAFTALLPDLSARFPTFAVVRNPLSLLASWNSTRMPVNDGHAPAAERHDAALKRRLASLQDRFDRQICLLSWYFEQYRRHLPPHHVVRYEDVVVGGGTALAALVPSAGELNEPLDSKNLNRVYDWEPIAPLVDRLLCAEREYAGYYSVDDVRAVWEQVSRE